MTNTLKQFLPKFLIILFLFLSLFSSPLFAQDKGLLGAKEVLEEEFAPQSGVGTTRGPVEIASSIIRDALGLLGIAFVALLLYGGYLWMTARGESDRVEKAKDTITNAVIGIVIIVLAYAITAFVFSKLTEL